MMNRTSDADCFAVDERGSVLDPASVWLTLERGRFRRTEPMQRRVEALRSPAASLLQTRGIGRRVGASDLTSDERSALPLPIREAELVCFCVATAGRPIDERARALCDEGRLIDALILDAYAMTALSRVADALGHEVFAWAAAHGLAASRSFSPGAGSSGWPLERQRFVFAHLPDDRLGVRLTEHHLMQPSKSVSFVIGIGSDMVQAAHPFSCAGCDRLDCRYRHVPEDEMVRSGTGPRPSAEAVAEARGGDDRDTAVNKEEM